MVWLLWKILWQPLKKLSLESPEDSVIPVRGIHSVGRKASPKKNAFTDAHGGIIHNIPQTEARQTPTSWWKGMYVGPQTQINSLWEMLFSWKKAAPMLGHWGLTPKLHWGGMPDTKAPQSGIPYTENVQSRHIHRDRKEMPGCRGLGWGESGLTANWDRVYFWDDGNILELDSSKASTT